MIVYREQKRTVRTAEWLARQPDDLLIETGELESGMADAFSPAADNDGPLLRRLRRATLMAARGVREELRGLPLPETVTVTVPEGYAYYALYPETYRRSARRYFAAERPGRVAVIGIRSIGTSLSAAVAVTLEDLGCEVHSWTVRPRGHPFDRKLALAHDLEDRWRALAGTPFLIVDEGPGLSGSSFAAVARALSGLGVPEERIVFFPSWDPAPENLINEEARRLWARRRRYVTPFEELNMFAGDTDLSGGAWRGRIYCSESAYPAVHPQHERRKYLRDATVLFKFAGLGGYGRRALERARQLAEAGFAPPVLGMENGFLSMRYVPAQPSSREGPALLDAMAAYLAYLYREFRTGEGASGAALEEMIRINTAEGLGTELAGLHAPEGPAVALDGRMLPQEWIATGEGWLKTDGVEHHDDHFFPGPQDIAWDVAAAMVEFDGGEYLLSRYIALSGDRGIAARLPFYRVAWLAFRMGYSAMAARALEGAPDGARFAALKDRYAALLGKEAAALG